MIGTWLLGGRKGGGGALAGGRRMRRSCNNSLAHTTAIHLRPHTSAPALRTRHSSARSRREAMRASVIWVTATRHALLKAVPTTCAGGEVRISFRS